MSPSQPIFLLTLSRLYFSSLLTPAWGVISPYVHIYIIHPVLVTFMYTCHHWFCQVVHNSHFHASTYPNICITFHIHYSIRVLLVSIQWSIVNEHGHNTHTMHMVRDRFRLLDAIVDPPSSFSDLIHVYHYKRYPILLLIVNDTLRFWMICRNWMTLAGLLWAMIDWRSKRQRETPVIRVVDRENVLGASPSLSTVLYEACPHWYDDNETCTNALSLSWLP